MANNALVSKRGNRRSLATALTVNKGGHLFPDGHRRQFLAGQTAVNVGQDTAGLGGGPLPPAFFFKPVGQLLRHLLVRSLRGPFLASAVRVCPARGEELAVGVFP